MDKSITTQYLYHAFISHNGAQKPWVRQIVMLLRESGISVFFDEDSIKPGENIVVAIENALKNSRHVLLILSPKAVSSVWIALEWSISVHKDPDAAARYIIPVLYEDCEIPLTLSRLKYLDARNKDIKEILEKILNAIEYKIELKAKNIYKKKSALKKPDHENSKAVKKEELAFNINNVVPPESKAYINREVDNELWTLVKEGPNVAFIWGPRKMGKTSMLLSILNKAKKTGLKTIFITFQKFGNSPLDKILNDIYIEITYSLYKQFPRERLFASGFFSIRADFFDFITGIKEEIIIALDEVDCLSLNGEMQAFFEILRSIYEYTKGFHEFKVSFIISSFVSPREFINDENSSPFTIGSTYKLSNFTFLESKIFLTNIKPTLSDEEIKIILDFTGGHPYLINYFGYYINSGISVSESVKKVEIDTFDFYYHSIYGLINNNNSVRQILDMFMKKEKINRFQALPLVDKGILVRVENSYRISCGLYEKIINEYYSI